MGWGYSCGKKKSHISDGGGGHVGKKGHNRWGGGHVGKKSHISDGGGGHVATKNLT